MTIALLLFALAALAFGQALVCNTADDAAQNRGDPEEPKLLDGGPANEHDEVDEREAEADGDRGKACRSAAVGSAHDHEQEDCRKHGFNQECAAHAGGLAAEGVHAVVESVGPAVGGECANACVGEVGLCDAVEHCRSDDTADDLRHDVGRSFLSGEAAAGNLAERDGRVQVAARNVADGVCHGEHGEAECERHAHVADTGGRDAASKHGGTAAAKHKPEGADSFGNGTSSKFHKHLHRLGLNSRCNLAKTPRGSRGIFN